MDIPMKLKNAMIYYFSRYEVHSIQGVIKFIQELRTAYPLNREYQRQLENCQYELMKYQDHTKEDTIARTILEAWVHTGNLPHVLHTAMEVSEEIGIFGVKEPTISDLLKENEELRKEIKALKEELTHAKSNRSAGRLYSK